MSEDEIKHPLATLMKQIKLIVLSKITLKRLITLCGNNATKESKFQSV